MMRFLLLAILGSQCAVWASITVISTWLPPTPSSVYAAPWTAVMATLFWLVLHHDDGRLP